MTTEDEVRLLELQLADIKRRRADFRDWLFAGPPA
jgi:hypothetical protein